MSQITSPVILDSTGQDIVDAIASLSNRANDIENFTSSDVADGSATAWTSVTPLASGEVHSSIFAKISQMFKNIRYLYKMLGTTNISSIGGGTVTGAISTLNSKLTFSRINSGTINNTSEYPQGVYVQYVAGTVTGAPLDSTGVVITFSWADWYVVQLACVVGSAMVWRKYSSSAWSNWIAM